MKFLTKQIIFANLIVLITILAMSISSYLLLKNNSDNAILELEKTLYEDYEESIRYQVQAITSQLTGVMNQVNAGVLSEEAGELVAADVIRNAKYGESGYFWADDLEGNNVVFPGREDVEGTNRDGLQDIYGTYLIQDLRTNALAGGGYLEYWFPKPNEEEAKLKIGYAMLFEPYGWVIGTGNYVDDLQAIVVANKASSETMLTRSLLLIGLISLVMLAIGVIFATLFAKKITKPINDINTQLKQIADLAQESAGKGAVAH